MLAKHNAAGRFMSLTQQIEKSQYVKRGIHTQPTVKTQPSIHLGLTAIESLTPSISIDPKTDATQYTDVQGLFIVETECEIATYYPTHSPYGPGNCAPQQQFFFDTKNIPNTYGVMFGGLQVNTRV